MTFCPKCGTQTARVERLPVGKSYCKYGHAYNNSDAILDGRKALEIAQSGIDKLAVGTLTQEEIRGQIDRECAYFEEWDHKIHPATTDGGQELMKLTDTLLIAADFVQQMHAQGFAKQTLPAEFDSLEEALRKVGALP